MAKKTKNSVEPVTTAGQDVAATAAKASSEPAAQPMATAGASGDATKTVEPIVGAEAGTVGPAKKPSAAVRMMTKSVAFRKPSTAKGRSQRVTDAAKPSQKPAAGGTGKAHRKGASKGR